MAKCKTIHRENIELCAGDLRSKVKILAKAITPSSTGGVDFTETYTTAATVWAMIKTDPTVGATVFDETMTAPTSGIKITTHEFYIRYRTGVTAENVIEYNNKYYDVIRVMNLNEQDSYLHLLCRLRGDKIYLINQT